MGIVVIGAVFVDIKGFPIDAYIPTGRNAGHIKYIHGGVSRNVVEDIANVELRPTFLSIVDESALGQEVIHKLQRHKVNTKYIQQIPEGMGTWLAVFSNDGDLAGSISQRPNLMPILDLVKEKGDEIFKDCDSIVLEADIDPEIIKVILDYSKKYNKNVTLENKVDKSVLGGVLVRLGNTEIDGTIKTRLDGLKNQLSQVI